MKKKNEIYLLFAFALIACCLRAPITGVGSMLSFIKEDLSMNNSIAGMLTTIPLLTFGVLSALVGKLGEKQGAGNTLLSF